MDKIDSQDVPRTMETVQEQIKRDYDALTRTGRKSWRKLAESEKYNPIPAGTLADMAKGIRRYKWDGHPSIRLPREKIKKSCPGCGQFHREVISCPPPDPDHRPPPRQLSISRTNPDSMFKSIVDNLDPDDVHALADLLIKWSMSRAFKFPLIDRDWLAPIMFNRSWDEKDDKKSQKNLPPVKAGRN